MYLPSFTIPEISELLRQRKVSATEIATEALNFAKKNNGETNAYLSFSDERALAQAEAVDRKIANGESLGALAGVPIAVKDVILTKGLRTTCGSKLLEHFIAPYDATAITRLELADGVIIGKTNCDEFAMGSSNENSAFGPVRNPVDTDRVPGGSSGGSAAVVAQGTATVSLGSDTGGSIRQPASFCGTVGVTPTYGRVSRYGLVAFASSLDHIGPFARTVRDAATLLEVIAGHDPLDATSAAASVPNYAASMTGQLKGTKIGVPKEYFKDATGETVDLIHRAIEVLRGEGCTIVDISLPSTDYAIDTYYVLSTAEASSNLARYDGVRYTVRSPHSDTLSQMFRNTRGENFGAEVKRRIMLGTYVLSHGYYDAYYKKSQQVRTLIVQDFQRAFAQVDAIVAPVSPFPAFKRGEKLDDPLQMYLSDIYTVTGSLAGIPCMSVPCGRTSENLPVGLQILCNHFDEEKMFRIADGFERVVR